MRNLALGLLIENFNSLVFGILLARKKTMKVNKPLPPQPKKNPKIKLNQLKRKR